MHIKKYQSVSVLAEEVIANEVAPKPDRKRNEEIRPYANQGDIKKSSHQKIPFLTPNGKAKHRKETEAKTHSLLGIIHFRQKMGIKIRHILKVDRTGRVKTR